MGLAKEVQFLQSKTPAFIDSPQSRPELNISPELQLLNDSLPSASACDKLLEIYTTNCEKIFRVVHVPSSLRRYASFWQKPDPQSSPTFVPLLMAILAVAVFFDPQPLNPGETSS